MYFLLLAGISIAAVAQTPRQSAGRALDYLSREVPAWKKENRCYSCHNNGDAARALIAGHRGAPLDDTLLWLSRPQLWDAQQPATAFRDKKLARVQFAFALAQAFEQKRITDRNALDAAAAMLQQSQSPNGSWPLEQEASIGSPATYGTALATYAALRVLALTGRYDKEIARGRLWMQSREPVATPDLAAQILTFPAEANAAAATLLKMQTSDGGWGPYRATPAEAFDTALAILALGPRPHTNAAVDRGVAWLVANQMENGGWPATTRPSGNISYAQHLSTTGWATLALLSRLPP